MSRVDWAVNAHSQPDGYNAGGDRFLTGTYHKRDRAYRKDDKTRHKRMATSGSRAYRVIE